MTATPTGDPSGAEERDAAKAAMTPSKIADPLLPEQIAELIAKRKAASAANWGYLHGRKIIREWESARDAYMDQLLSAAERGIAAGEEAERLTQRANDWEKEAKVRLQALTAAEAKITRQEADLAASKARIGALEEQLRLHTPTTPEQYRAAIRNMKRQLALLTPTHTETER